MSFNVTRMHGPLCPHAAVAVVRRLRVQPRFCSADGARGVVPWPVPHPLTARFQDITVQQGGALNLP
jgi:hypothetical protein